jgi:hypothetical protein
MNIIARAPAAQACRGAAFHAETEAVRRAEAERRRQQREAHNREIAEGPVGLTWLTEARVSRARYAQVHAPSRTLEIETKTDARCPS